MGKNAANWPKMIRAVYASIGTGRHSGDATTKRVMDRAVSWLTAGLKLSPKLQAALLRNIEQRTRYGKIDPSGPIALTRHQLSYLAKTNPEWFGLSVDTAELGADDDEQVDFSVDLPSDFQLLFAEFQHDFGKLSAAFPHESLGLAQRLTSLAAENCQKIGPPSHSSETKVEIRKEEISGEALASACAPATEFASPSMSHEVAGTAPGCDFDVDGEVSCPASQFPSSVTLWVKEDKAGKIAATGYFEIGQEKFALVFSPYEHALERMTQTSSRDWLQQFDADYNRALKASEQANTGVASRATLSALYAKNDTRAFKAPEVADHALAMSWENNAPAFALFVDSRLQWQRFNFKQEAKDRFKGVLARD